MSKVKSERNDEIIRLRDEEKKTFIEIARILGLSNQRVAFIYYRESERLEENDNV